MGACRLRQGPLWGGNGARHDAARGTTALRFGHAGLGDSDPRRDALPFEESSVLETRAVLDHAQRIFGAERFVLLGLCSGASTAFLTAQADPRVAALVLINPPGGAGSAAADTQVLNEGWAGRYLGISQFIRTPGGVP